MRKAVAQYLRHLRAERDASDHTIKSYREDLLALAEYLEDDAGRCPAPGVDHDDGTSWIRRRAFRGGLRQGDDRTAASGGAEFLPIWPARRMVRYESGRCPSQSAARKDRCPIFFRPTRSPGFSKPSCQPTARAARPGHLGDALLGWPPRQ